MLKQSNVNSRGLTFAKVKQNKKANAGKTVVVVLLIDLWVTLYFKLTATLPLYVVYRDSVFF